MRVLEEEKRRVVRELKREAIEEALELSVRRLLGAHGKGEKRRDYLPGFTIIAVLGHSPRCGAMGTTGTTW